MAWTSRKYFGILRKGQEFNKLCCYTTLSLGEVTRPGFIKTVKGGISLLCCILIMVCTVSIMWQKRCVWYNHPIHSIHLRQANKYLFSLETDCRHKTDFFPQKRFKALRIFFSTKMEWRVHLIGPMGKNSAANVRKWKIE